MWLDMVKERRNSWKKKRNQGRKKWQGQKIEKEGTNKRQISFININVLRFRATTSPQKYILMK